MTTRPFLAAACTALLALAAAAQEAPPETVRVRGEVTAVAGDVVTVEDTSGEVVEFPMAPNSILVTYVPIMVGDLAEGDFLSIPSLAGSDGEKVAVSINVFPEQMRGVAEGEQPWDLGDGSLMTNATIGAVSAVTDGNALTVTHFDVEEEISVPEGTPITRIVPTDRDLAEGDRAIILVQIGEDGPVGIFSGVMEDGSLPPV